MSAAAGNAENDDKAAEAEFRAAIDASESADAAEAVAGLGPSPAPLYLQIRPSHKPEQYASAVGANAQNGADGLLALTYFTIPGLGESPRLLLAEAGADYDHFAMIGGEDMGVALNWRGRSPNGLLPTASGWGIPRATPLCQSGAILRFLARRCGMDGGDDEAARARADILYETAKDMGGNDGLISAVNPDKPADANAPGASKLPFACAVNAEKMLKNMGDPSDHSSVLNFGQIQLYNLLRKCEKKREGCVKENLGEAMDNFRIAMEGRPGIAAYLKSPVAFPYTKGELGKEGGYVYAEGSFARGDRRGVIN